MKTQNNLLHFSICFLKMLSINYFIRTIKQLNQELNFSLKLLHNPAQDTGQYMIYVGIKDNISYVSDKGIHKLYTGETSQSARVRRSVDSLASFSDQHRKCYISVRSP